MTMNVTTAPTNPLLLRTQGPATGSAASLPACSPEDCPPEPLAGDQVATAKGAGRMATSTLTLVAAQGNTVTQGDNNVTLVRNFNVEVGRPAPKAVFQPKQAVGSGQPPKPAKPENGIQLIARGLGKFLNTITFGFFGALGRGLRGE